MKYWVSVADTVKVGGLEVVTDTFLCTQNLCLSNRPNLFISIK